MLRAIAAREDQMLDACTVARPGDAKATPGLDPDTGMPAQVDPPTVYDGPCTLSDPGQVQPGRGTVNDGSTVPNVRVLKVPHRAALQPGDLVRLTACSFSPGLAGDMFLVLGEEERSYATCRRYQVRGSSWLSPGAPA